MGSTPTLQPCESPTELTRQVGGAGFSLISSLLLDLIILFIFLSRFLTSGSSGSSWLWWINYPPWTHNQPKGLHSLLCWVYSWCFQLKTSTSYTPAHTISHYQSVTAGTLFVSGFWGFSWSHKNRTGCLSPSYSLSLNPPSVSLLSVVYMMQQNVKHYIYIWKKLKPVTQCLHRSSCLFLPAGLVLVTDAITAMGLPPGRHTLGQQVIEIQGLHAYVAGLCFFSVFQNIWTHFYLAMKPIMMDLESRGVGGLYSPISLIQILWTRLWVWIDKSVLKCTVISLFSVF